MVELFTGLCLTAVVAYRGPTIDALALTVVLTTLVIGAAADLELLIYPDRLSFLLIGAGVVFAALEWPIAGSSVALDRIGGGAIGYAMMWGLAKGYHRLRGREGLGLGDVKICTAIGLFLGIKGFLFFTLAWSLSGSIVGGLYMAATRRNRDYELPTGGWYVFGLACVLLFPSVPARYLTLLDDAPPYGHSRLAIETVGRSISNGGFGAGVPNVR
jgi:leader peptidase (prepilin peptidase)/N-methyltransferase